MLYGGSIPPGHFHGQRRDDRRRLRGDRRPRDRAHERRGPRRARVRRQPRRRRVRRPVHRQHDGDGLRGPRDLADGPEPRPRPGRQQGAGRLRGRPAGDRRAQARPAAQRDHHQGVAGERDRRRRVLGRLDQRASCTCSRSPARSASSSTSTTSTASASARRCCATSSPPGATSPSISTRPAACRSCCSACRRPACSTRSTITVTGQTIGELARDATETEGQRVVRGLDEPLKATGGLAILRGNLAPEGCVDQARRPREAPPRGPGARLRRRGGGVRRGHPRAASRPATSWSSATRARPAARACARCSP